MGDKPYSAACDRNHAPILQVLHDHFADRKRVLEVGSGTGQHAVYFAKAFPRLVWQASDRAENHDGIRLWLEDSGLDNVLPPLALDVNDADWRPAGTFDAVFTANTFHIMSWEEVGKFFRHLPEVMAPDAVLVVYGPFNYGGQFTSESNARFQQTLKTWGPHMGIRDVEAVQSLAQGAGLGQVEDRAMPAHNRCMVWRRR